MNASFFLQCYFHLRFPLNAERDYRNDKDVIIIIYLFILPSGLCQTSLLRFFFFFKALTEKCRQTTGTDRPEQIMEGGRGGE